MADAPIRAQQQSGSPLTFDLAAECDWPVCFPAAGGLWLHVETIQTSSFHINVRDKNQTEDESLTFYVTERKKKNNKLEQTGDDVIMVEPACPSAQTSPWSWFRPVSGPGPSSDQSLVPVPV